ncbi:protein of unknown function [Cupriavidus neocaledonicus]|uniref:Uncharacterized protein n=1 Tax=Cupriavidus neocaledonicus TaxID=1040979 RepID=A0A375H0F5_9BURK|nr:protein of unknown function [Cupriavidus neocaledonicus]
MAIARTFTSWILLPSPQPSPARGRGSTQAVMQSASVLQPHYHRICAFLLLVLTVMVLVRP